MEFLFGVWYGFCYRLYGTESPKGTTKGVQVGTVAKPKQEPFKDPSDKQGHLQVGSSEEGSL